MDADRDVQPLARECDELGPAALGHALQPAGRHTCEVDVERPGALVFVRMASDELEAPLAGDPLEVGAPAYAPRVGGRPLGPREPGLGEWRKYPVGPIY